MNATKPQPKKEPVPSMTKPITEWSFTAKPDWARICRELAVQGATVGRVTEKGGGSCTLIQVDSPAGRAAAKFGFVGVETIDSWGAGDWNKIPGDVVDALLAARPHKVEAFAPLTLADAKAAPAPTPEAWAVWTAGGLRSVTFSSSFPSRDAAVDAVRDYYREADARYIPDYQIGKVSTPGRESVRALLGAKPAPKRWGLFIANCFRDARGAADLQDARSTQYPDTFATAEEARQYLMRNRLDGSDVSYTVALIPDGVK